MSDNWIQTYTGKKFDIDNLDPSMVCLEDIAHALSMLCRYNGHSEVFYSVAEHCVMIKMRKKAASLLVPGANESH